MEPQTLRGNTDEIELSSANALRSVQRLLWEAIEVRLKEAERDEVKRAVGILLVEDNQALFAEATALAEILGNVQLNTSALLQRKQLCSNPERSMVETDILLVMDRLRSMVTTAMFASSAAKDRNPDSIVPKADITDKAIYEYMQASTALQGSQDRPAVPWLRPSTASSRPQTASTLSRPSTASSTTSTTTAAPDTAQLMACVQGKLSIFSIDEVKDAIQCALHEERMALMNDIDYLTALLTDETDLQMKASAPPPSLQELKQYSQKLKSLVQSEQTRLQHEVVVSRMFDAAQSEPSKAGRLRRMVGASREGQPTTVLPHSSSPSRTGLERPLSSSRTSPNHILTPPRVSGSNRPPSQGSQGQGGDSILTGVAAAPHPRSHPSSHTMVTQGLTDCASTGQLPSESPGIDSPDSTRVSTVSSSLSGSIHTITDRSSAGALPPRVQSAPHPAAPASASCPPGTTSPAPSVQRSGSGRRHLIQALRASSANRERDKEAALEPQEEQQPVLARSSSTALPGMTEQPALQASTATKNKGQMPKLAQGDLLEAHAEVLKGGVAAILAKHQYQPRSKPEPG